MKKIISIILVVAVMFIFCACGTNSTEKPSNINEKLVGVYQNQNEESEENIIKLLKNGDAILHSMPASGCGTGIYLLGSWETYEDAIIISYMAGGDNRVEILNVKEDNEEIILLNEAREQNYIFVEE